MNTLDLKDLSLHALQLFHFPPSLLKLKDKYKNGNG